MPLTRLDNLISSKTGKYLYVSPDDFNATDALSNRGNSPVTPFKSIQRAFLEIARYSYLPGFGNDRFDQFSIMLMPGIHYIDNRPGLVDTSGIDVFGFDQGTNAWTDDSILDLSNPDNVFYKFNNTEGGAIIPRGSSLVGYDLRRTVIRPLFVPDPAVTEREIPRSAIFNVTGGCYFWQFTLKDGQTTVESPLYDAAKGTGEVYYDPTDFSKKAAPNYSHHKLTVFEYADNEELGIFYRKIAKAFSAFQPTIDDPGEFDTRVQENRIVGPLSDSRVIESLKFTDATTDPSIPASTTEVEVTTKVDHGYFQGQFVAIANTEIDDVLEGIFQIKEIDQNDARKFKYDVPFVTSGIGSNIVSGQTISVDTTPALGQNAQTLAEVDSVESASPYVFNVSIRSTWGICGIWANGLKATGFKSVVIAQYTGVSLQKDDRSFIRYDEYTNTWNQASLTDAFATVPYHTKGDAYWKDEWRNFHVRASEDAFIQCVSIFAVGFADHFLMESGGDMSITNSNSNFGNTSLHAIGHKGFSFNQDKGGYITDIVPPKIVVDNTASTKKINYYTIDIQGTLQTSSNYTKLFLGSDNLGDPLDRPAATITGYRIGAKSDDKLYVKLDKAPGTDEFFDVSLEPTGFVKYVAKGSILNPTGGVVNSVYADAANLIESNRRMMQEEVFGYILEKYPRLQNIPYVNPGLNPAGNRFFDARNLIQANRQEIVDQAWNDTVMTFPNSASTETKCKRDIGLIVDAVSEDLKDGGNANIIAVAREYFDGDGNPIVNGLVGEERQGVYAFNRARDLCKQAIANLLTVKADLYDPDSNSNLATYGINVGKTGSQAEEDGDTTNGVTIDLAQKVDPASRYKDARNRVVANREFILDAALAEVTVYHPDFYHSVDGQTNSQSRLADAFRLIRRNSTEIKHKALASIAVAHPNFYIDGDQQTDSGSRYASAYRLIAENRDQIVDTALAETTVGHPDYFIPGDQQTDARSRYADGYRLIVQNRTEIVNTAWADMLVSYPNHGAYEEKCKRDLGIFVDAIALDLFVGGNKYSRKFISEYFSSSTTWISGGLQGEESQSIEAFNQARDQMKLAVANQLSIQDLTVTPGPAQYNGGGGDVANTNSGACDDVQSAIVTLTDIVTSCVSNGNLNSLPGETSYISGPGEEKCRRDIGIFVDSLALDLFLQSNVYSYRFAAEFFTDATTPVISYNSGVYITNVNKAAEYVKKALTNQLYFKDNGTQGAIDRTADNAPGSAYGQVSKDFTPHGATYTASSGDMVLDIANHGLSNGDRVKIADNSLTFNCLMDGGSSNKTYPRTSDPVSGQYIEITSSTTDSITVNVGASPEVTFTPTTGTTYDPNTGLMVLEIGAHSLTAGTSVKLAPNSLTFSCGFGGASGAAAEKTYPRSNGNDPFYNTSINIESVTATTITLQVLTTVPSTNTDAHTFVSATAGAVITGGNYTHTFVSAAADAVNFGGNTENELTDAQPFLCSDVQSAVDSLTSIVTGILADGDLNSMPVEVNYGTGKGPGEMKCARDIGYFIDAITVDMYCEGNKHTRAFTEQYFTNATTPLANGLVGEESEAVTAYNTAINEMKRAVTNQLYYKDLTVTEGLAIFSGGSPVGTPTAANYIASTGAITLTIPGNSLQNGDKVKIVPNALTFTCDMGTGSPHTWVGGTASNAVTVNGSVQKDVTDAAYTPTTGILELTIGSHSYTSADSITIATNSLTFTCDKDQNQTTHTYPRATDPAQGTTLQIISVTGSTITVNVGAVTGWKTYPRETDPAANTWLTVSNKSGDQFDVNVGASPIVAKNVTGAVYSGTDGTLELTIGAHSYTTLQSIFLEPASLTFTCDMDGHATEHTYPRVSDPAYNTALPITAVTATTITVDVGTTPIVNHDVTDATYVPSTGELELTIGSHSIPAPTTFTPTDVAYDPISGVLTFTHTAGEGAFENDDEIKIADDSLTFSCDAPMGTHVFVQGLPNGILDNLSGNHTAVAGTTYTPATGVLEIEIGSHTLTTSNTVTIAENAVTFTCAADNNASNHAYPRATDPAFGQALAITAVTATTITVNVGIANASTPNGNEGTYPRATDPVRGKWLTISNATATTFDVNVGEANVGSTHTFVSATTGAITKSNARIKIGDEKLSFTCDYNGDGNNTVKSYPRNTIDTATATTGTTYNASTGLLKITTLSNHGFQDGDFVKFEDGSLTFKCDEDSQQTNHAYPRSTDPVSGEWIKIDNVTGNTFEVNILQGTTPTNTTTHVFVSGTQYGIKAKRDRAYDQAMTVIGTSATTITLNVGISSDTSTHTWAGGTSVNAIQSGGSYNHIFVSATSGAVKTGGDYNHTFVKSAVNAITTTTDTVESRTSPNACADVQSAIDTLGTIATDAITAGNITGGIWNSPVNNGTFITGEAKCRRDLGIVVDAVAQDLWFGGNEFTISATKEYFQGNQLLANGIDATKEVAPAITAFKRAEELMQRALNNTYYDRDLNITLDAGGDPPIVSNIECDAHDIVLANKEFIAKEAYLRMKVAYPSYTPSAGNTEQDCLDDVYDVLREVMWDVKFGGNYKTYDVAKGYITNDFNGTTYPQILQDVERDEVAKVFTEVKDIAIQVMKQETVTVSSGNTLVQKIDDTIVDDWDNDELLPKCGSVASALDTLMGIIVQAIGNDGGVGNLNGIQRSTYGGSDPAWNTSLNIISKTATSITINVGVAAAQDQFAHTFISAAAGAVISGGNYDHTFVSAATGAINVVNGSQITPNNATYDPATGYLVFYFGAPHGVLVSDQLSIDANSLTFSCGMDQNNTTKTYPRIGTDPVAGANVNPVSVTTYSITVDVGASPLVNHNVSNAVYDAATGDIALTIGSHSLEVGTSIKLREESLVFSCTKDQNKTTHAYPRSATKYQPSAYADGNCSDVLATVNALVDIICTSLNDGNLNSLPPLSSGEWDCANVRSSIENLYDIITEAIETGSLDNLPVLNTGDYTIDNEASKCFRDVTYIVDAIVNDLRLGGNINSIQAGEAYYVGMNLEYIDGEKTETLDAWNYTGSIATAAMRNFDVLAFNCSTTSGSAIIDVNDTRGIIIGMSVKEYENSRGQINPSTPAFVHGLLQDNAVATFSNIPEGTYVKRIVSNTQVELGVNGSRLAEGNTVNALQSSTTTDLYFVYESGIWADTLPTTVTVGPEIDGPDIIQDTLTSTSYRECSGTADAIETIVGNITTIINSGLGTVTRQEQTVNTALLASRATVFTIDTGGNPSDPHKFETGTPVRLVPRPRFDVVTKTYVDVDKRLVRLPNGFETNRTYYVIAPGRVTQPENYGSTSFFDGNDQTRLMLATSKENAAAGIYIYASETDAIDKDVEIDLYQFVLDDSYDLHNYKSQLSTAIVAGIETDVSHIFDKPSSSIGSSEAQTVFIRAIEGGLLPLVGTQFASNSSVAVTDTSDANVGRINPNVAFFVRYANNKTFTIHQTYADSINGANPIIFATGQAGLVFDVFANKRRSPMRFDPTFTDNVTSTGKWYIACKDEVSGQPENVKKNNVFWRIQLSDYADRSKSTDMWYERLDDTRTADDRTYKIRYVIPKYLENARDPINGFVLKTRTDDTRKLVPQKVLLKPVVGTVYGARFENPVQAGEYIGYDSNDFLSNNLNLDAAYDPYKKDLTGSGIEYRGFARFTSGVQSTIQSGRYVEDTLDPSIKYLELTLNDHTIDTKNFPGLRNEILTTIKINAPQGGNFVVSKVDNQASDGNAISFSGNSSGLANVHAYYTTAGQHYLIIKNIRGGTLEYSEYNNTRFTQGTVFADMLEDQDSGKSLPLKTNIAKGLTQYYYKQNGANVYTITPGDRIQDDAGVEYYVASVEDTGIIDDTFYIFGYETLQKRIAGQQDGIYYITALRGNLSPFPTGAGVTNNFKKFKFSQPVSKLYPLNFRNDPLWFKNSGTTQEEKDYYAGLIDPPATFSAADNYTQGLVTVNDFKNSLTRELIGDFVAQPAFVDNTFTSGNQIQAQSGNATSGSEDRLIPISGDSTVLSDQRYYVELRRPSIARAGNHTFEYLGFGPGNYSTGLPARQEVVLTPEEDFYAQSKKQDGGIVFYTGINSQGDLYIGNKRINAITGEETFIDKAELTDDGDEDDTIGGLVTTFDTPVTFNQNITVIGGDGQLPNTFESPVVISVQDGDFTQQKDSLIIRSNVDSTENNLGQIEQDEGLDRTAFSPPTEGDIRISKNTIRSAVFGFNARGKGQSYKFQTHTVEGVASNITPNQSLLIAQGGTTIGAEQVINYGGVLPIPGDVLFKGSEVGKNGSIAWVLANYFATIANDSIDNIQFDGTNVVKLSFRNLQSGVALTNTDIGITSGSQIRIKNLYYDNRLNLTWTVYAAKPGDPFSPTNTYVHFQVIDQIPQDIQAWEDIISGIPVGGDTPTIEFSNANFKEVGVLGAEALRTETETIGEYKLGINTIVRSTHDAYKNAFVEDNNTDPKANLDVVGNVYISGRRTTDYLTYTQYASRTKARINDALVVGGDSDVITDYATLRVSTETSVITEATRGNNEGKVGVNVTDAELDRALVVKGDSRFTEDVRFERDIEVNGDGTTAEIRTSETSGTFNAISDNTFIGTLNVGDFASTISIGNQRTEVATLNLVDGVTGDQYINIGRNSFHSNINLGTTPNTPITNISKVEIGGAYGNNETLSYTQIRTKSFKIAGDVQLGTSRELEDTVNLTTTAGTVNFFGGNSNTNILNFATNASDITIAGQGGTTRVRNSLIVDASARFNSSMTLCGGFSSFSFTADRARSGSEKINHSSGILGNNLYNNNVDIVTVDRVATSSSKYCTVDTAGTGNWGGIQYQDAITNIGGNPQIEPQELVQLTGNQVYIPLGQSPVDENGSPWLKENDYIIIDSPEGVGENYTTLAMASETLGAISSGGSFLGVVGNVSIAATTPGASGSTGGFNTNQNYIWFSEGGSGSSSSGSERSVAFSPVDGSNLGGAGPISRFEIDAIVGNNTNGGEYPDVTDPSSAEHLELRYSLDAYSVGIASATWVLIDQIIPIQDLNTMAPGVSKFTLDVPVAAQQANVTFQLYQPSNTGVDNYGITNVRYFSASNSGGLTHVEFLKVISTPRISTAPYYIVAEREPFGTFTGVRNDHPDGTAIYKCNVQFDATWITDVIDNVGDTEDVYLAEFGGIIATNDYVIISRSASVTDVEPIVYDIGEVFQVKTTLTQTTKSFTVSSGCDGGAANDVFTIDSTTGDTYIGGDLVINNNLDISGGCGSTDRGTFQGNLTINAGEEFTFFINNISTADLAKLSVNDLISFESNFGGALLLPDTRITEIDADKVKVSRNILSTQNLTNVVFRAVVNEEFTIKNGNDQNTLYFDTCAATMEIGNQYRRLDISRVLPSTEATSVSYARYEGNESTIRLYSYWEDPLSIQANGPTTTLTANATTGAIAGSVYLQVDQLGEGTGAFAVDDLVRVNTASGGTGVWEMMKIAAVDVAGKILRCLPGQEGTAANDIANYVQATTDVVRILKHGKSSNLVDIDLRQRSGVDYISAIIDNGIIVQTKLDYTNWLRLYDKNTGNSEYFLVNLALFGTVHTATMNELGQDGTIPFRRGNLTVNGELTSYGGGVNILDSVGQTSIVKVINDDGHADHSGSIYFDAGVIGRGDIKLYSSFGPEEVLTLGNQVTFAVDVYGDAEISNSLTIRGTAAESPSKSPQFSVTNLGINGANSFTVNRDQSIDAFGLTNFYTKTGGRHSRYITNGSDPTDLNLKANVTYFVNVTDASSLIVYLPESPTTGDEVRIVEVGGNLGFDTMLVMRALTPNTKVQGDSTGTTIGLSGTTPYNSGELVVQTANAGFTLVYLGGTDSQGTIVSSSVQGWWLREV